MTVQTRSTLHARLEALVVGSSPLMQALRACHSLGLASWCIGAGMVRNLVWDHLHGFHHPSLASDIDLVFYDANNLSGALEQQLTARLQALEPALPWEVVNQAAVHLWRPNCDGTPGRPFQSLEDGIASWPETATCVGVSVSPAGCVQIHAPHGLDDLFSGVLRWNPTHVPHAVFVQRLLEKRFKERWPKLRVLSC